MSIVEGRGIYYATYVKHKSVKGYKGYWKSNYVFNTLKDEWGNIIADSFTLGDVKCIKGKRLKAGDVIQLTVTISKTEKGKLKVSRPADVFLVGHDISYDS